MAGSNAFSAWRRLQGWGRLALGLFVLAAMLLGPPARAQSAQTPRTITVVLDDNYPPFIFRDATGNLQGILVDRWALWQARTGIQVQLAAMDWGAAQATMQAGQADVIDTMFATEARQRLYDFSAPYERIDVPIFFHQSISGIVNADSVKGFTVGVKDGDACIDTLRAKGVESLKRYDSYSHLAAAAKQGDIRVFCMDKPPALYLLHQLGVLNEFKHSVPLSSGDFHRAVHKGNTALLALVERGFADLPANDLQAIETKWYGAALGAAGWTRYTREALYGGAALLLTLGALTMWNVTLRRRVRARTRELSRLVDQLDATLSAVPDLLFELDIDGRYHDYRAARTDLLVVPPEQFLGRLVHDSMPKETADTVIEALHEAAREGYSGGRQIRLDLARGEHWFELTVARKRAAVSGGTRFIVLSRDITDRKQTELALQRSERSFRQFFEAGLVGMAIAEPDKRWSQYNPRMAEMLGYSMAEMQSLTWAELTHPDDVGADKAAFARMMSGEMDAYTTDKRYIRKDGTVLEAAVAIRCDRDATGGAERFFVIIEDIGARKAAERALERHSGELEALVEDRSRELTRARDQAQEASRAKSDLLSRMSHEFRTPMNAILGFSQLLEVDQGLAPSARRFVTEILRAGKHLLELINDVLDLAHVESGRMTLSLGPVEIGEFVPEVLTLMQPLANRRNVALEFSGEPGLVAMADRTRLKQVLVNLVSNAIKYNRSGGQVKIEAHAVDSQTLRVVVRDTGPGIDGRLLPHLFEPFNRLGAEFGGVEGTGIGLSICHRLVDLMGGAIGVDSRPGDGSEFWVDLPRSAKPVTAPAPTPAIEPQTPWTLDAELLYIEDSPANMRLMEHVVARLPGLRLLGASSAEEGLALARAKLPKLILMDINLPGMDGYAALDALRDDPRTRHIPVVSVTANAMPTDARRAIAAGFAEHLVKPIDLVKFEAVLRRNLTPPGPV